MERLLRGILRLILRMTPLGVDLKIMRSLTAEELTEVLALVESLRTRASIRRQIPSRKSVQENKPDRLSDLLEKSADTIEKLLQGYP